MGDSVFRSTAHSEPGALDRAVEAPEPIAVSESNVEVPYLDKPDFIENYFGLGTQWKDHDATFASDIQKIDSYIKFKIANGDIPNDQKAVTKFIKSLEKVNGLKDESRSVVKLEILANYTEFLAKNEKLKSNLRRYGSA